MKKSIEFLHHFTDAIAPDFSELIALFNDQFLLEFQKLSGESMLGYHAHDFDNISIFQKLHPDDKKVLKNKFTELKNDPHLKIERFQVRMLDHEGIYIPLEVTSKNLLKNPMFNGIIFRFREIGAVNLSQRILSGQKHILESIANGKPLKETLNEIARFIESLSPEESFASVLLLDEAEHKLYSAAAPSLPESFLKVINGLVVGDNVGSCGTSVYRKKQIISDDIETDPLWVNFKDWIIGEHGLKSCWSTPLMSKENSVYGTFALYFKRKKTPTKSDLELIDAATHLAVIAIERKRSEASFLEGQQILSQTESRYKVLVEGFSDIIFITDYHSRLLYANPALKEQTGFIVSDFQNPGEFDKFFHPDDLKRVERFMFDFVKSRKNHSSIIENRFIDKNGHVLWFSSIISRIEYDGHQALQFISRNITELKAVEEKAFDREARYSALFDGAKDAVLLFDEETGVIIDANSRAETLFDRNRIEIIGLKLSDLHPKHLDYESSEKLLGSEEEKMDIIFTETLTKSGKRVPVEVHTSLIDLPNRKKLIQRIYRDVTEKNRLELLNQVQSSIARAINSSKNIHELFKLIHRSLGLIIDTTNFFIALNDKDKKIITFPYFVDLMDEDYALVSSDNEKSVTVRVIKTGKPLLLRSEFFDEIAKNSEPSTLGSLPKIWLGVPLAIRGETIGAVAVQSYSNPNLYSEADINILMSISEQIAIAIEKKQAEDAIRKSEERYRAFIEHSTEGIYRIEFDNPIPRDASTDEQIRLFYQNAYMAECNQVMVEMYGYHKMEDVLGMRISQMLIPTDPNNITYLTRFIENGGRVIDEESHELDRYGIDKYFLNNAIAIYDGDYWVRVWGTQRDISNRKLVDKALWEEKERLAVTLRSIADGVITTNIDGKIILMNKIAEKYTGWTQREAYGNNIDNVFHVINEKQKKIEYQIGKILKSNAGTIVPNTVALLAKDGTERVIEESSSPIKDNENNVIGAVIVFRDITDKKKMEDELLRSRKIESVGVLAGGIAHDFNNILTAVLGNISLAKMTIDEGSRLFNMLDSAEKASSRAISLTQQLLTFSKGGAPIKKAASIRELLVESATFALRGTNVSCTFEMPDNIWTVEIDEGQINQVVNNLVINSVQAMPDGGNITIGVDLVDVNDARPALLKSDVRYIKISVRDNGIGIAEKDLTKIFDPYFSTKQKGSGLGLATSFSIISKHDGIMTVESQVGVGTCFYIYLPASEKELIPEPTVSTILKEGHGRILIMDDEDIIRHLVTNVLTSVGYEVVGVADGKEAISVYKQSMKNNQPFDLVIMDLTIPGGMGGKQAVLKIRELNPDAVVIVSSGYSNDPIMSNHTEYGFKGVLNKPFKARDLLNVIGSLAGKITDKV